MAAKAPRAATRSQGAEWCTSWRTPLKFHIATEKWCLEDDPFLLGPKGPIFICNLAVKKKTRENTFLFLRPDFLGLLPSNYSKLPNPPLCFLVQRRKNDGPHDAGHRSKGGHCTWSGVSVMSLCHLQKNAVRTPKRQKPISLGNPPKSFLAAFNGQKKKGFVKLHGCGKFFPA